MLFKSIVLAIGKHKDLSITKESLISFVSSAELPLSVSYNFMNTALNGKLGRLVFLEVIDDRVYGTFDIPDWLLSVKDRKEIEFAVSINRETLKLNSAAVVDNAYFKE